MPRRDPVFIAAACLAAVGLAVGCSDSPSAPAPDGPQAVDVSYKVIAEVNGQPLYDPFYQKTIDYIRSRIPRGEVDRYINARTEALDSIINDELIFQEAQRLGLEVSDETVQKEYEHGAEEAGSEERFLRQMQAWGIGKDLLLAGMRKRLTVDRFVTERIIADLTVSEGEAIEYYNSHLDKYTPDLWIEAHHILIRCPRNADPEIVESSLRRAEKIRENLLAGEPFHRMAKEFSEDPTAPSGRLGFIKRGYEPPEFDAVAFSLRPGEISEVVRTDHGFHIILVTGRRGGEPKPFEEVKDSCLKSALREKQRAAIDEVVQRLRRDAVIRTDLN